MIIKTADLNAIADKLLKAVDTNELTQLSTALELEIIDTGQLILSVSNKEYFVTAKLPGWYASEEFHASVNANLFLKLITQITTEDIELECKGNYLYIKGNGSYKLPLIFKDEQMLVLDKIEIYNPTCEMTIDNSILQSIIKYNSKELTKGFISKPVQRYYYVDEKGCITFTTGACVNRFKLDQPVRMLLNSKLVNLFKLFNEDVIDFTLGYDSLSNNIVQTKVRFETETISITAILQCDDAMLNSVPVNAIRGRAEALYPYSVVVSKDMFIQAINRMMLFNKDIKDNNIANFVFTKSEMTMSDSRGENSESLTYLSDCEALETTPYTASLNLNDLKATLQLCDEAHLTIKFGVGKAFIIARTNIINVIPECIFS